MSPKNLQNIYVNEFSMDQTEGHSIPHSDKKVSSWEGQLLMPALWIFPMFCNYAKCYKNYWFRHFNYNYVALELILAGDMYFEQKGKKHCVKAGEIYIIHSGVDSCLKIGPSNYCEKISLGLKGSLLEILLKTTKLSEVFSLALKNPDKIRKMFEDISLLLEKGDTQDIPDLTARTVQVIMELALEISTNNLPVALSKAINILEYNIDKPISVNQIAKSVGLSAITLRRLFKEHLNTSPKKYSISLRIESAKQMLKNTNFPIKKITNMLGYQNQLYFTNEFKKRVGTSPTAYRNSKK